VFFACVHPGENRSVLSIVAHPCTVGYGNYHDQKQRKAFFSLRSVNLPVSVVAEEDQATHGITTVSHVLDVPSHPRTTGGDPATDGSYDLSGVETVHYSIVITAEENDNGDTSE
jgi:hypothetical protein